MQLAVFFSFEHKVPQTCSTFHTIVLRAMVLIANHCNEDCSLSNIAHQVAVSPTYLSALFKRVLSVNFVDYVRNVRMASAKLLLLNSTQKISSIALTVGIEDVRYFGRLFKQETGMTPTEYRRLFSQPAEDREEES